MYKIIFKDLDNMNTVFEIGCNDLKILTDDNSFKSTINMYVTKFDDYTDTVENDILDDEPIRFKMLILEHNKVIELKRFLSTCNIKILVEVTKGDGRPRSAIIKTIELLEREIRDTDFYNFEFKCIKTTHWIDIVSQEFRLDTESLQVSNYADSDTYNNGYTYTDNFVYGSSNQTLESFRVTLPANDGDKYAYMQVTIDEVDGTPGFGLNDGVTDTVEGYQSRNDLIILPTQRIVLNSYKPFKKLILQSKTTGEIENIEKYRIFSKRTYLRVPKGDTNFLEFTNVKRGSVILYKQYRLPY